MNWFNEMLSAVRGIAASLKRIADTLDKMNVEADFSDEDKTVLGIAQVVKEATDEIPKEKAG